MSSNDVKTLIEQRASALADGFRTEDVNKLMSFFSEDVDFSDIGTPAPDALRGRNPHNSSPLLLVQIY